MPARTDPDIRWLIVYVLLSRVRSLDRLRSVGMQERIRKIIEGGAPQLIAETFQNMFQDKIVATKLAAQAAKQALGW